MLILSRIQYLSPCKHNTDADINLFNWSLVSTVGNYYNHSLATIIQSNWKLHLVNELEVVAFAFIKEENLTTGWTFM